MASPFSYFRRNQRTLMALLTLAAMFTFVCVGFLGFGVEQLLEVLGIGRQTVHDPVVVRTHWTTLTASDLHGPGGLVYRRIVANRFVDAVQRQALQFAAFQGFGAPSEEDVVMGVVLRHKAKQMGLTVDDAAVDRFLLAITAERLTAQGFINARDALNVPEELVYGILREELLAYNASVLLGLRDEGSMFASQAPTLTPEELRDSYHKLRDRAEIEAVAVPAEAFLGQTSDPSEAQLRAYFERYREFFGHPMSPMPGFRQHRRIEAEYVRADFDATVEAISVADEEIDAYYEENKETEYRLPDESETTDETDDADPDATTEENASSDDASDDSPEKQGGEESAVETPKLFSEPLDKPETHPGSQPGAEKPDASDPGATEGTTSRPPQGDSTEETTSAPPPRVEQSDQSSDPSSQPEAQDVAGETGSPQQSEGEQSETEAEIQGKDKGNQPVGKSEGEKPSGALKSGPRYTPLDDVLREEIRNELKRTRARELIDELFGELQYEVFDRYYDQYGLWEAEREEAEERAGDGKAPRRPRPKPPAPEPLEVLGQRIEGAGSPSQLLKRSVEVARAHERFGRVALEYGTTSPISVFEISDLEGLGEARECMRGEPVSRNAPPFPNVAFQLPGLYASAEVCEIVETEEEQPESFSLEPPEKSHTYLFWKVQDEPEFTPQQLGEVRDQVERAWRMDQARALAQQRAEQLAQAARKKGTALAESLASERINPESEAAVSVLRPSTFTWLSRPEDRSFDPPGITDVKGIENAGEEFMRTVFDLAEGAVGVAPDAPEKTFYVVRADVIQPAPRGDLLREDIFGFMSEYQQLAQQRTSADQTSLVRQLIREAGVKWERGEGG